MLWIHSDSFYLLRVDPIKMLQYIYYNTVWHDIVVLTHTHMHTDRNALQLILFEKKKSNKSLLKLQQVFPHWLISLNLNHTESDTSPSQLWESNV